MPSPSIRPTQIDDLPSITEIYGAEVIHGLASFEETAPSLAEMTARWEAITAQGYPHRVCVSDQTVLGYAYASAYRARAAYRHTVECSIYLAPEARGQGIGRMLLDDLIEQCKAGPWRQMIAVIGNSANAASVGVHRAAGFRMVGTLTDVGYKHAQWVDTVLMQRAL